MFTIRPSRQEMYANDSKFLWKYILRSLATVLAITGIGLIGWSLAHQVFLENIDDYEYYYYYWPYDNDHWFLPWEFITLGLSIIWNVTNILVLLLHNRPIHPGANVACDLLLWLGFTGTSTLATVAADLYLWWYPEISYEGTPTYPNGTLSNTTDTTYIIDPCTVFTDCSSQQSYTNHKGVVIAVGAALSFIVLLMHFALFVSACRYTNARRVDRKASVIAERMYEEKVRRDREGEGGARGVEDERDRNPNARFVPISEPVEREAPLGYGMPPAGAAMRREVEGEAEGEQGGRGGGFSYGTPEVVVHHEGGHGTDDDDVSEA